MNWRRLGKQIPLRKYHRPRNSASWTRLPPRKNPGDPEPYCERARWYTWKGEFDKAIADYTKVLEINPNYLQAYRGWAYTYISMAEGAQNRLEAKAAYKRL